MKQNKQELSFKPSGETLQIKRFYPHSRKEIENELFGLIHTEYNLTKSQLDILKAIIACYRKERYEIKDKTINLDVKQILQISNVRSRTTYFNSIKTLQALRLIIPTEKPNTFAIPDYLTNEYHEVEIIKTLKRT